MLTFDSIEHRYFAQGRPVPGVTSILESLTDYSFVDADVLKAAADFGTAVHLACELDDKDDLDETSLDPEITPYLRGWRKFCRGHNAKWEAIEERVFNQTLWYAGTLDRRGEIDGVRAVVDIKTCSALYPSVGPQLAAYARAHPTGGLLRRFAVRLYPDGYELKEYTDPTDWPVFCSLLTIQKWSATHGVTPKFKGLTQ